MIELVGEIPVRQWAAARASGARKPGAAPLSWRQPCLMATFVASGVVAFGIGTRTSKMPLV